VRDEGNFRKPAGAISGQVKHFVDASALRSLLHKNGAHYLSDTLFFTKDDSLELPRLE
jgi:hypothetical protein